MASFLSNSRKGSTLPNAPMNRGVRADIEAGLADGSFRDLTLEIGLLMAMGMGAIAVTHVLEAGGATEPTAIARDLNFGLLRGLGVAEDAARAISAAAAADIFKET